LALKAGSAYGDGDYSLGKADPYKALENIFWFASPFTWVDITIELFALSWELIRNTFFQRYM
jgi:hypothetical protein